MELCRLINSCSYLSFTSSLYLCLFRYTMVFIRKGRNWEAAYYICKICIRKKGQCYPKITSHQINVIFIWIFLYLMSSSNVDRCISNYIVLYFKISISECCTDYCSFCICFEERNYISLSCFMAYDNITLNRKSKKRNEITIYRKDPTLCPIILIPSVCTINEIILRRKIDTFIIFSLTEQKGLGRDCTN